MNSILLDTNAYVAFKQGRPEAAEIVQRAAHLALSSTVLGELFAGFAVGSREAENRTELHQFLESKRAHILPGITSDSVYPISSHRFRRLIAKISENLYNLRIDLDLLKLQDSCRLL